MSLRILNEQDYYRIVYGGWLGKNIGGTLGCFDEGKKELLSLTFYPKLPDGPLENDDLDLQLVWLHALEQYGPGLTARELGQEWLEHIFFPFDEYGYALTNLRRGLLPPVAGAFNNPFADCMGSPIRSEIWAMVAPGSPSTAAYYAYQDAVVDHAGGEGVFGEMFFAAIESAIFFERDRDRLIRIGLGFIPEDCRTAKAVRDLVRWHAEGADWIEARSLVLEHHGHDNFTDAPQNIAFTILGWLYGHDFEDAILKAVNCGYDTDCTAATLGAILGMLLGPEGLPEKWAKPVGDRVVVSKPIKGFPAPANLDELTRRTIRMGKQVLAAADTGILVHPEQQTVWNEPQTTPTAQVEELWGRSITANRYALPIGSRGKPDLELEIEYGAEGPAIGAGQRKRLTFTLTNLSLTELTGTLAVDTPHGWSGPEALEVRLEPGQSHRWEADIEASAEPRCWHELAFRWTRKHDGSGWSEQVVPFTLVGAADWTVWGPDSGEAGADAWFAGNRLNWETALSTSAPGVYRARTALHNPAARQMRLIAAANAPVKLKLDGQTVIDCTQAPEFMPAYHRAHPSQLVELTLAAGRHELEIEAVKAADDHKLEVYVLPVAIRDTDMPGPHYYFTDMRFGL